MNLWQFTVSRLLPTGMKGHRHEWQRTLRCIVDVQQKLEKKEIKISKDFY